MTVVTRSLIAEACLRMGAQVAFAATLLLTFATTRKTLDLGLVSVAMLVPSLAFTWWASRLIDRWGVTRTLRIAAFGRAALLVILPMAAGSPAQLAAGAGLIGLLQLILTTAKLRLDVGLIADAQRTRFNSRRALLGSLATILGPSLVGFANTAVGPGTCLVVAGGLCLLGALLLPGAKAARLPAEITPVSLGSSLPKEVFALIAAHVTVLAVLEMEVPLVFPWIEQAFGQAATRCGPLFGVCGVGAFAGATLLHRLDRLPPSWVITGLLILDGAVLYRAVGGVTLPVLYVLFALLGVISTVAMVTVETRVQRDVAPERQAGVFALIGLAGGAGGAALTLGSTAAADWIGAAPTLAYCALLEIVVGVLATLWLVRRG